MNENEHEHESGQEQELGQKDEHEHVDMTDLREKFYISEIKMLCY